MDDTKNQNSPTSTEVSTNLDKRGSGGGQALAEDTSRAPEQENRSLPEEADESAERLPHEQQPPFSELYGEDKAGE